MSEVKVSKVINLPNQKKIHDEAAEWLVRIDASRLSKREVSELTAWLQQSDLHKQIFRDTVQVWEKMDVMEGLAELLPLDDFPKKTAHEPFLRLNNPVLATIMVCVICISFFVNQWLSREIVYQTKIGVVQSIDMKDGSEITLNTDTKIGAKFDSKRRDIELQQGEAFFDVAHNDEVPFIVTVGSKQVQAVGTAFSVRKQRDIIKVTVTDGRVKITNLNNTGLEEAVEALFVDKGQMVQIGGKEDSFVQNIEPEQIAQVLMWQKHMLAFNGESLKEVVEEFERYTEMKLLIIDEETAQIRVGGYFRSNDLDGLLLSLKDNFGISAESVNATTLLLSRSTP